MVLWDQHFNRIYCHPQFCMRSHHRIRIMFETSWKFSEAAHSGAEFVAPKKKMFFVSLWKIRSLHSSTASTRPGQTVKRSDHNKRDDSTMGLFPGEVMMDILMNHVTWNCFGELPAGRSCCWWKIAGEPVNRWLILVYPYIYICKSLYIQRFKSGALFHPTMEQCQDEPFIEFLLSFVPVGLAFNGSNAIGSGPGGARK